MTDSSRASSQPASPLPPDDLNRTLTVARPNVGQSLPHIGLVGDTYTILLTGGDTAGRYCLIDMHIPPGGGPGPHRHDFEESFTILDGEIEATFRGATSVVRAGETVNIPANAPHQFTNRTDQPGAATVRLRAVRAGRVLQGRRRPRRDPDDTAPRARRCRPGGVPGESRGAGPDIPHGAATTRINTHR